MIWITQWLCPSRHCAIAVAWDDQESTAEQAESQGEEAFTKGVLNQWCGICRHQLHVEHGCTSFKTMDEALPYLKAVEKANLQARVIIGNKF